MGIDWYAVKAAGCEGGPTQEFKEKHEAGPELREGAIQRVYGSGRIKRCSTCHSYGCHKGLGFRVGANTKNCFEILTPDMTLSEHLQDRIKTARWYL